MKAIIQWCFLLTLSASLVAQSTPGTSADDLKAIREMVTQQQQQIQQLQNQLQQSQESNRNMQQRLEQLESTRAEAKTAGPADAVDVVSKLKSDVDDLKANVANTALSLQDEQKRVNEEVGSPLAIHFKGITITPGGFFDASTVWRQHGMTSDVNTPFNAIPFAGADQHHLSEFFGSGRPSRITGLIEGKLNRAKFTGYAELDWLSAGVTSNNNQSNSYTNRMRQLWAHVALDSGWSFTGGQMWSLVTETKNGMDNRTEAVPSVIDHQYNVGFSWARQYGFRVVKNWGNRYWLGLSVENAQTLLTAHGNANNFVFGNAGTGGGLYNATANYSYNVSPDYVVKAVFQPKYGHYEIFGLLSPFRDRVYPNATATPVSAAGAFNDSKLGGGLGANARWLVANKHLEFGLHFLGGDGIGRYGTSSLPDATIRPDGTLALLRAYHGLGTLEYHHPKFDVYFNAGSEHIARSWRLNAAGAAVGYGSPLFNNSGCLAEAVPAGGSGFLPGGPANCTSDTRNLIEYSAGFWIKFYNGPKGRVQWGPQYSHIVRNLWTGVGGGPQATQNMIITSFRYYLP